MDIAKAEVREAKTTTAIEKKAICYQMAVDDFDQQTENVGYYWSSRNFWKKKFCLSIIDFLEIFEKNFFFLIIDLL